MVRRIRNPLFGTLCFGDVLVGGNPSAVRDRMVHNGDDAPIEQVRYLAKDSSLADRGQDFGHILLEVVREEAARLRPGGRGVLEGCSQA